MLLYQQGQLFPGILSKGFHTTELNHCLPHDLALLVILFHYSLTALAILNLICGNPMV
jgi:hypothetical protein